MLKKPNKYRRIKGLRKFDTPKSGFLLINSIKMLINKFGKSKNHEKLTNKEVTTFWHLLKK